jgi:BirA family biotin operon repressor/biotin-[acetyl-CoA-carboxylase] ligase
MDDRDLLAALATGPTSGEALAARLGISRSAVHKRIESLREAGIGIDAQAGRGYELRAPCDLLDVDAIRARLTEPARALLATLEVEWIVDSSNSVLLRREGVADGAEALLVEGQSGGRGRRGREWRSPLASNLYLSLARRYAGGLARLGGLSLAAGVAVAEALHSLGVAVQLKWPNDLVVPSHVSRLTSPSFHKLGGLLVEGGGEHAGPARAVIGLGLNVRMTRDAAQGIDQPWIDLATAAPAAAASRNALAATVLSWLLPALEQFDREGLAPFRERYAAFDALRDREVAVLGAGDALQGVALGIAEDGGLRVQLSNGEVRTVHAGEVSVRAA